MKKYVSLLRGINVGGHNKIKMKDLQEMFRSLGFEEVKTYIQSGNVVFLSEINSNQEIEIKIRQKIKTEAGYEVNTLVKTQEEWREIIENNPFLDEDTHQDIDISKLHITLLSEAPDNQGKELIISLEKKNEEQLIITDNCVYQYHPNGYGKTKFHNTFLEKKLGVSATTRNWRTSIKIDEMLFGIEK